MNYVRICITGTIEPRVLNKPSKKRNICNRKICDMCNRHDRNMCNRTPFAQVHKLPESHCGDNWEEILLS